MHFRYTRMMNPVLCVPKQDNGKVSCIRNYSKNQGHGVPGQKKKKNALFFG